MLLQAKGKQVEMTVHDDRSLLALQGPAAAEVLQVRCVNSRHHAGLLLVDVQCLLKGLFHKPGVLLQLSMCLLVVTPTHPQNITSENLKSLTFSSFRRFQVSGIPVWCTRTG
jgi:hypothetical protein